MAKDIYIAVPVTKQEKAALIKIGRENGRSCGQQAKRFLLIGGLEALMPAKKEAQS